MKHRFPEPCYVEFSVRFLLVGFLGNIFGIWLVFLENLDCLGFFPNFCVDLVFLDVFFLVIFH